MNNVNFFSNFAFIKLFIFSLTLTLSLFASEKANSANDGTVNFETTYYSPMDIQASVVNLDSPNSPIREGSKIRFTIICKIRGTSLPRAVTNYFKQSIPIDSRWDTYCSGGLSQKDKFGKTYEWDGISGRGTAFSYSSDVFEIRSEAIYTLVSSEPVYISLDADVYTKDYDGFYQKGSMNLQQLFVPSITNKTNSKGPDQIISDDGFESDDELNMTISIAKEKNGSYLISLSEFQEGDEVKIVASRKASKTFTFVNEISQNGDLKIRTKRNLKGYKVQVFIDDDVVLLATVK